MSDVVSFAEIDGQRVELLPARTLLQTLTGGSGSDSGSGSGNDASDPLSAVLAALLSDSSGTRDPFTGLLGGGA